MSIKIIEALLISSDKYKKLFGDGEPESIYLIRIIGLVRTIVEDILFDMFFESAEDDLRCLTIISEKKKKISMRISLTENFYNKHFGNLIPEEREKELNELISRITEKLDKINWEEELR